MNHEDSQMMKILETIADRLIDMHLANQRQFAELRSELEARLPAKVGEQLSLLAIVTGPEAVVPNEDEAMPVVEPVIVQDEPHSRNKMPAHIKQLSSDATRLANEGNEMIRQASDMIAASTGHVSKEAQRLLNEGHERLNKSADLKSEYGKYQKAAKKASKATK